MIAYTFEMLIKNIFYIKTILKLKHHSRVSFHDFRVSLSSFRANLIDSMVDLNNIRVNLNDSRVSLDNSRVNLNDSRVSPPIASGSAPTTSGGTSTPLVWGLYFSKVSFTTRNLSKASKTFLLSKRPQEP